MNGKGRVKPDQSDMLRTAEVGSYSTTTAVPLADTISMLPLSPIAS